MSALKQLLLNELINLRQRLINQVEEGFIEDEDIDLFSIWYLSSLQTDYDPHFNRNIFYDFEEGEERIWCKRIIWDYNLINLTYGLAGFVRMPDRWIYRFISLDDFEPYDEE